MSKYDFIYLFSNLFRLISLNGPSGGKKAHEGGGSPPRASDWGRAGLGGPNGAHLGPAHQGSADQACGDSPTLPDWQVSSPLGAYIRRSTPGLLIHQLIPQFSLDFVIPFVGVALRREEVSPP